MQRPPRDSTPLQAALEYRHRGWAPIDLTYRSKNPNRLGWQKERLTEGDIRSRFNAQPKNIGLLLGEASGGLTDVDLDCPEARLLAPFFLPSTGMVSGRQSAPRSHWWYRCQPIPETRKFTDPIKRPEDEERAVLVELRSSGCHTLVPPSVHPDGETYQWDLDEEPATVDGNVLKTQVSQLAAASLLARSWPARGLRHSASKALAGGLLRAGWDAHQVEAFILAVATAAGDEEARQRPADVRTTVRRIVAHRPATGWPELSKLVGPEIVDRVREWLGVGTKKTSFSSSPMSGKREVSRLRIIPSTEVPLPEAGSADGELGPFLPAAPSVVLLSGETSAGKTVLAYNLALALAKGDECCGLRPQQPRRVLYLDLESPEPVYRELVETVGRSNNLAFIRALPRTLNTPEGMASLRSALEECCAEVVVLDPLAVAWPVRDENDNAEADRQMQGVKRLAVEIKIVLLALWNMGEGNPKEKYRARGATARLDRADLALNYTELTDTTRQLKIVKSRYGTLGMSLTVRFAGDLGFEAVESTEDRIPSKVAEYQARAGAFIADGKKERRELIAAGLDDENTLDRALHLLVLAGELVRVRRGFYDLPVSSFPANIGGKEKEEDSRDEDGHELSDSYLTPLDAEALRLWPSARIEPMGSG